jgi:hypothetical protein
MQLPVESRWPRRQSEDCELSDRGEAEHSQRKADCDQALPGAFDARVDQAVRMTMPVCPAVVDVGAVMVERLIGRSVHGATG